MSERFAGRAPSMAGEDEFAAPEAAMMTGEADPGAGARGERGGEDAATGDPFAVRKGERTMRGPPPA